MAQKIEVTWAISRFSGNRWFGKEQSNTRLNAEDVA